MNASIGAKLAEEALKPTSGFIDALIAPKVKRLRKWAESKDLISRKSSNAVDNVLNIYLRKMIHKVSSVTTIIFPERGISINKIYEKLYLNYMYGLSISPSMLSNNSTGKNYFDLNCSTIKKGENYLIVDSAGMGKSTFVKNLFLQLIIESEDYPIFLELRRISEDESLLSRIALDIDETNIIMDESLLRTILKGGGYVIILDGYDELPEQYRSKINSQIIDLANYSDNNSIILTSRPELGIPVLPSSIVFSIEPLSEDQAISLIRKYDRVAEINLGESLIKEFKSVPNRFIEIPLLVALLYKTYGFNRSIANRVTSFYDEVYDSFYKGHDLSKNSFSRPKLSKLDSEDFRKVLRSLCFFLAIKEKNILKNSTEAIHYIQESMKLTNVKPYNSQSFFEDLLRNVPFIIRDGTEYRFIHKSIGEFFAAEFLAYHQNPNKILSTIKDGNLYKSFIQIIDFMAEINPSLFKKTFVKPVADYIINNDVYKHSIIHTALYFGEVFMSIWKENEINNPRPFEEHEINKMSATHSRRIIYKNMRYKLIIGLSKSVNTKEMPFYLWKSITSKVDVDAIDEKTKLNSNTNLDFMDENWISIKDKRIDDIISDPYIRGSLFVFMYSMLLPINSTPSWENRVIDVDVCRSVLEQIKIEEQSQIWLETILSDSERSA